MDLKEALKVAGVAQSDIAQMFKCSQQNVSAKINKRSFTLAEIQKIFAGAGYKVAVYSAKEDLRLTIE